MLTGTAETPRSGESQQQGVASNGAAPDPPLSSVPSGQGSRASPPSENNGSPGEQRRQGWVFAFAQQVTPKNVKEIFQYSNVRVIFFFTLTML